MSAWMTNPIHVAALVRWYANPRHTHIQTLDCDEQVALANMLHRENALSVNYRYASHPAEMPHLFKWPDINQAPLMTPVQAIKAAQCLRYQSCEHPGWDDSEASRFCERVISAAISMLPGYDAAPWGIDSASDLKPMPSELLRVTPQA